MERRKERGALVIPLTSRSTNPVTVISEMLSAARVTKPNYSTLNRQGFASQNKNSRNKVLVRVSPWPLFISFAKVTDDPKISVAFNNNMHGSCKGHTGCSWLWLCPRDFILGPRLKEQIPTGHSLSPDGRNSNHRG